MVMVVRCACCMAEYRLNEAVLKGAKGACIRCPKCGERIMVENPHAPPAAPSITQRVIPPAVTPPIPQRVPPPVVTPPVTPRVEPPGAPPISRQTPPPSATPIELRVPPPTSPPVPPRVVQPLASRAVTWIASPAVPPQVSSPASPAGVETGTPPIRVAAPGKVASTVRRDRRAVGTDVSGRIRPDPVAGVDDGIIVSPTPPSASDPSGIPVRKALRLEEFFIHPAAVAGDRIPGGGEDGPTVIRSPGPGWNPPPRRPQYRRPLFLAVAIPILLLTGGAFYFIERNSGRTSSGNVIPVRARSAPEHAVFDVGNLKGSLNRKVSGDLLYIVKGTVTNGGKTLSSGIRIEATLLGQDNQAIVRNGTFAGNVIDESLISHMTRVRIEGFLGMRYGEGDANRDIPAGKTLPFMVVFFNPPEGVESFRVRAIEADEADRIDSPGGEEPGTQASKLQQIRLN
jgi:DNA-directed RNA polymerase subunit RPC12/RpoP